MFFSTIQNTSSYGSSILDSRLDAEKQKKQDALDDLTDTCLQIIEQQQQTENFLRSQLDKTESEYRQWQVAQQVNNQATSQFLNTLKNISKNQLDYLPCISDYQKSIRKEIEFSVDHNYFTNSIINLYRRNKGQKKWEKIVKKTEKQLKKSFLSEEKLHECIFKIKQCLDHYSESLFLSTIHHQDTLPFFDSLTDTADFFKNKKIKVEEEIDLLPIALWQQATDMSLKLLSHSQKSCVEKKLQKKNLLFFQNLHEQGKVYESLFLQLRKKCVQESYSIFEEVQKTLSPIFLYNSIFMKDQFSDLILRKQYVSANELSKQKVYLEKQKGLNPHQARLELLEIKQHIDKKYKNLQLFCNKKVHDCFWFWHLPCSLEHSHHNSLTLHLGEHILETTLPRRDSKIPFYFKPDSCYLLAEQSYRGFISYRGEFKDNFMYIYTEFQENLSPEAKKYVVDQWKCVCEPIENDFSMEKLEKLYYGKIFSKIEKKSNLYEKYKSIDEFSTPECLQKTFVQKAIQMPVNGLEELQERIKKEHLDHIRKKIIECIECLLENQLLQNFLEKYFQKVNFLKLVHGSLYIQNIAKNKEAFLFFDQQMHLIHNCYQTLKKECFDQVPEKSFHNYCKLLWIYKEWSDVQKQIWDETGKLLLDSLLSLWWGKTYEGIQEELLYLNQTYDPKKLVEKFLFEYKSPLKSQDLHQNWKKSSEDLKKYFDQDNFDHIPIEDLNFNNWSKWFFFNNILKLYDFNESDFPNQNSVLMKKYKEIEDFFIELNQNPSFIQTKMQALKLVIQNHS